MKKPISFRIEPAVIEKLRELAKTENRTLNNYAETVFLAHIQQKKKKPA